jgi:branched-chain amino acid transport system permease protein
MNMYWFVAAVFVICFLLIHRIVHSPFGQVLKAIRENEPRTTSLGYRTDDYKLVAFILSATIAGVAGGTKSLVFGIATLTDVHWSMSGEVLLMTLVGGLGTVFGPMIGAAVIVAMQNYLAEMGAWVTVIQGVIFIACVLAFRRGIVGEIVCKRLSVSETGRLCCGSRQGRFAFGHGAAPLGRLQQSRACESSALGVSRRVMKPPISAIGISL